jgi:hypothetical protein
MQEFAHLTYLVEKRVDLRELEGDRRLPEGFGSSSERGVEVGDKGNDALPPSYLRLA